MQNAINKIFDLPKFSALDIANIPEKLAVLLKNNLVTIERLINNIAQPTWDNFMVHLEELENAITLLWAPVAYLHGVVNSSQIRECFERCLPMLSDYGTTVGQNAELYAAIKKVDIDKLLPTQQKIIQDALQDFELSGVALPHDKKQRFKEIEEKLALLSNQFENNLLDATQAYSLHIIDINRLNGLPEYAKNNARKAAISKGLEGYILSIDAPMFLAVFNYAEDRKLREEIYHAYVTRASEVGPLAGKFDNSGVMEEILKLRYEKAKLLGFVDYSILSLQTKMAQTPSEVHGLLNQLITAAKPQAKAEYAALCTFAKENLNLAKLEAWDIGFASERYKELLYDINEEALRPYFPEPAVLNGLFGLAKKLYGIDFKLVENAEKWVSEVLCYEVIDEFGVTRGFLYMDLLARENKRSGAWMDDLQSRWRKSNGALQLPIATLTCNFARPSAGTPCFTHDEVVTLFHEFGHCMHHVLTQVEFLSASGIAGVEWDAVELPSQCFENWCWSWDVIQNLTAHVETQEKLPKQTFDKLLLAKNFQSALGLMRQMTFALFDWQLHENHDLIEGKSKIADVLREVRTKTQITPVSEYQRLGNSFSHIFAGGYAAGYYSYVWAEVLSSDAFGRFEEEGILNEGLGRHFLKTILEVGGSKKAFEAFRDFRGRDATIDALLRQRGIFREN